MVALENEQFILYALIKTNLKRSICYKLCVVKFKTRKHYLNVGLFSVLNRY